VGYYSRIPGLSEADKHMEPFHVTFEGKEKEDLVFLTHKGEEFIYVLDGQLDSAMRMKSTPCRPGTASILTPPPSCLPGVGKRHATAIDVIYASE